MVSARLLVQGVILAEPQSAAYVTIAITSVVWIMLALVAWGPLYRHQGLDLTMPITFPERAETNCARALGSGFGVLLGILLWRELFLADQSNQNIGSCPGRPDSRGLFVRYGLDLVSLFIISLAFWFVLKWPDTSGGLGKRFCIGSFLVALVLGCVAISGVLPSWLTATVINATLFLVTGPVYFCMFLRLSFGRLGILFVETTIFVALAVVTAICFVASFILPSQLALAFGVVGQISVAVVACVSIVSWYYRYFLSS